MPLISVIIPFHNRLKWTIQAINSVFEQTIQDFELLLINDGSTEEFSLPPSLNFSNKIRYVTQENKGVSGSRNKGIDLSLGEYIAFLDSDDLYYPNKFELQVNFMIRNSEFVMSHTSYDRIDIKGNYLETINSGKFSGMVYPSIYKSCPIATPTVMIRRNFIVENNIRFDENIAIAEDLLVWAKIAKNSKILGIDIPLTKVRMHQTNASTDNQKKIKGSENFIFFGINKDSSLKPTFRKRIITKKYIKLSKLYALENDEINSIKYSEFAKKSSIMVWSFYKIKELLKYYFKKIGNY